MRNTVTISALMLLFLVASTAFAQEKTVKPKLVKKVARPDIPGLFIVDLGLSRGSHIPANWNQGLWGSRTLNVYYHYPIRIAKSNFSFNPGVGFGFDRYKMRNLYTLSPEAGPDGSYLLVDARVLHPVAHKSQIVTDYFDIPVDLRYDSKPEDRARSFSASLGGRFGYLYNTFTKVKYRDEGENKMIKDKSPHGLNPIRYGLYARVGGGGFNLFCFYNLSPLFATNKGPDFTKMTTLTIGISLNGL